MSKPAQSEPVDVAAVAHLAVDGSKKYTKETFEKLQLGARENHGTLDSWKTEDDGIRVRREFLMGGRTYRVEGATDIWHPLGNHRKPALPFRFSVFDFAAFILHGDGESFVALNFDGDDSEYCDVLSEERLCEERTYFVEDEAGELVETLESVWRNTDEEVQLLRGAYRLRAQARDRFDLRRADASEADFTKAAAWLLAMNTTPNPTLTGTAQTEDFDNFAPIAQGMEAAPPVQAHALQTRTNALAAVIDKAKSAAQDPCDWASVWAALATLAHSNGRPSPLIGYAEGGGVSYSADDHKKPVKVLTRDAFRKRWERARARPKKRDAEGRRRTTADVTGHGRTKG